MSYAITGGLENSKRDACLECRTENRLPGKVTLRNRGAAKALLLLCVRLESTCIHV